jgi:hypothetical protein
MYVRDDFLLIIPKTVKGNGVSPGKRMGGNGDIERE